MICYFVSFYLGSASVPYSLHFSQFVLYSCLASFLLSSSLYWVCFCGFHLIIYFFSFSVILLPFSFAGLLFYGFGTYHLQLMHTICLLKRTQWFSNATNKDNNKCLLINTFSSTFQCFRSKTRLISNHCVFFRHKIYFIFDHFHYDFYWTTVLYRQFLFSSVLQCFYHI